MITILTMMVIMTVMVILMMIIVVFVLYHPRGHGWTHFKLDPALGCPGQLPSTQKKTSTSPLPIHLQNNCQKTWAHVGSVQEKGVPKGTQVLELDFRLVNHLGPWPCLSALPSRWNNFVSRKSQDFCPD